MKRNFVFLSLLIILISTKSWGTQRSLDEMKSLAVQVLNKECAKTRSKLHFNSKEIKELRRMDKLSIIGYESGGFAIISSDDEFEGVLGYSLTQLKDTLPCNFEWFLESTNKSMSSPQKSIYSNAFPSIKRTRNLQSSVTPLITSKWGQNVPFNNKLKQSQGGQYQLLTGCLATAMAQLMNYYEWPKQGKGNNAYTYNGNGYSFSFSASFEDSKYDWDNMLDVYKDGEYNKVQSDAVASLMYDCAVSVNMSYCGFNGSIYTGGSAWPERALPRFFDYNSYNISRIEANDDLWYSLVYYEISNGRPVIISGGNHYFIIDGYDSEGLVSINWGWSGSSDGYYDIKNLGQYDGHSICISSPSNREFGETINIENKGTLSNLIAEKGNAIFSAVKIRGSIDGTDIPALRSLIDADGNSKENKSTVLASLDLSEVSIVGNGTIFKDSPVIDNEIPAYFLGGNKRNRTLANLKLPEQITYIGDYAFWGFQSLTSIIIPQGVEYIGSGAFQQCAFSSIEIPNSVKAIGRHAFDCGPKYSKDHGIESVYVPANVSTVGANAFGRYIKSITVAPGNTIIDSRDNCNAVIETATNKLMLGIMSTKIPESVTTIGEAAFESCFSLTSLDIPNSIVEIGEGAFRNCSSLKSLIIPNSTKYIRNFAFDGCRNMSSITIGSSVIEMGSGLFDYCTNLNQVVSFIEDPKQVTIFPNTFNDDICQNVILYVPSGTKDKYLAADGWKGFKEIIEIGVGDYVLTYKVDGEVYKEYHMEAGNQITPEPAPIKEGYTFSGWSDIPSTMPAHDVTVTGTFSINKYKLTYKVDGEVYKEYTIEYGATITPETAPTKEGYTFSGWSEIPSTMPAKDVTVTGTFTKGAYNLIYKVDGEVYKTISYSYGYAITPEPAPTKEGYTFSGWSEIPQTMPAKDVTVTGTFTINKYKLTYKVDGELYKEYTIEFGATITPEPAPTKDGYEFSGWSEIPSTMPANNVEVTGTFKQIEYNVEDTTYEISGEGTVTIKGGDQKGNVEISGTVVINGQTYKVTAIAENAFVGNAQITSVTIPEGITTIGSNAFSGCVNMLVINIGKSVSSIGNKAFANVGTSSAAKTRGENSLIVNCYAESVPQTASDAFENSPIATGTLLVNDNIVDAYKTTSPWSQFGKIQGFQEAAGIGSIIIDNPNAHIYDMQGNRIDNLQKGVNIIRLEDGKTKKVIVK